MQEIVRLPMPLQRHKYMIKSNICLLDSFSFPLSIENGKKTIKNWLGLQKGDVFNLISLSLETESLNK
jgi:hypothetical protein